MKNVKNLVFFTKTSKNRAKLLFYQISNHINNSFHCTTSAHQHQSNVDLITTFKTIFFVFSNRASSPPKGLCAYQGLFLWLTSMYNIFWPSGLLTIYGLHLVQLLATSVADPVFFVVNLFSFYQVSSLWELDRITFFTEQKCEGLQKQQIWHKTGSQSKS